MARTNPFVKGLAETRARAAGDGERYSALIGEFGTKLAKAQSEVAACDLFLRKALPRSDPGIAKAAPPRFPLPRCRSMMPTRLLVQP